MTDIRGRYVLNVLAGIEDKTYLLGSVFLTQAVCGENVASSVIDILHEMNMQRENMITFVTDNAAYMKSAFKILKPLCINAIHMVCFCHILNLVGEVWENDCAFCNVNKFIVLLKSIFNTSPGKKHMWNKHLEYNGASHCKLIPFPFEIAKLPNQILHPVHKKLNPKKQKQPCY